MCLCCLQYSARDEAVPTEERYRQTLRTDGQAIALMKKLVRRCRAAEQRTAYLSCRLLESDETIRQQEEKLAVYENDLMAFADGKLSECV